MVQFDDSLFCDGCGVEIRWAPVIEKGKQYCCCDCRDGLECNCGAEMDEEQRGRKNADLSVEGPY
jgi:hypothetical protein